jgi:malic enzyme
MPMDDDFRRAALDYHRLPQPGKLAVEPTKRMATQRDLGLAYSPGVAAACEAIVADPETARDYTVRGNLVAVISNGTAVLGLGNIGALAGKPVMEGKAVLFKKFAGIDVFDIEVDAEDPTLFCNVVAALEPARSTSRTSRRRSALRSKPTCAGACIFRCFTTISTGRRLPWRPRCATGWCCKARRCTT